MIENSYVHPYPKRGAMPPFVGIHFEKTRDDKVLAERHMVGVELEMVLVSALNFHLLLK